MRKILNTLYVTTPEAYLTKDGENVVIRVKEKDIFRIPVLNIEGIVTFGYIGASPALMKMCAERNVGLCFLSANGQFQGRVSGPTKGNVLLRRTQYRIADDANKSLEISRLFIAGKIANSRTVIDRFKRDHISSDKQLSLFLSVSEKLKRSKNQALVAESSDTLRGIEGEAATTYFSVFNQMIISQCEDFPFNGRNRRPPKDKVNALLSFVYTLLNHEVQSALETVGLDPYVGFLHTDRPGRASLALDMMEELRAYLADRLVLSLINRKQISGKGFVEHGDNGIVMDEDIRKGVLLAWQKRKKETIIHPYLNESVPIGLIPYIQAMLLARFLRNDLDNYPVFLMK